MATPANSSSSQTALHQQVEALQQHPTRSKANIFLRRAHESMKGLNVYVPGTYAGVMRMDLTPEESNETGIHTDLFAVTIISKSDNKSYWWPSEDGRQFEQVCKYLEHKRFGVNYMFDPSTKVFTCKPDLKALEHPAVSATDGSAQKKARVEEHTAGAAGSSQKKAHVEEQTSDIAAVKDTSGTHAIQMAIRPALSPPSLHLPAVTPPQSSTVAQMAQMAKQQEWSNLLQLSGLDKANADVSVALEENFSACCGVVAHAALEQGILPDVMCLLFDVQHPKEHTSHLIQTLVSMAIRGREFMGPFVNNQLQTERADDTLKIWKNLSSQPLPQVYCYALDTALKRPNQYIPYVWSLLSAIMQQKGINIALSEKMQDFCTALMDGNIAIDSKKLESVVRCLDGAWKTGSSTVGLLWYLACLMASEWDGMSGVAE